jgi:hypothetical protein
MSRLASCAECRSTDLPFLRSDTTDPEEAARWLSHAVDPLKVHARDQAAQRALPRR